MIVARSPDAASGVRFFQKYCRAFRPTTGIPSEARTLEISRSMAAQPPSPETKTTSVSDVPWADGTSTRGNVGVAANATLAAKNRRRIAYFIRASGGTAPRIAVFEKLIQQLDSSCDRLRCGGGRGAGVDDVGEEEIGVGFLVGSEADDKVALWLGEVFVGVAPRVVQERRRDVDGCEVGESRRQVSVDEAVRFDRFADLFDPLDRDSLARFCDGRRALRGAERIERIERVPEGRGERQHGQQRQHGHKRQWDRSLGDLGLVER